MGFGTTTFSAGIALPFIGDAFVFYLQILVSFGGTFPKLCSMSLIVLTQERPSLPPKTSLSTRLKKCRTRQEEQSHNGYFSNIRGESITDTVLAKIWLGSIMSPTCAKFQSAIFEVAILHGVEFSIFLLIFEWASVVAYIHKSSSRDENTRTWRDVYRLSVYLLTVIHR